MDNATQQDVLAYLQAPDRITAALATTNEHNAPRIATIYYAVDDEFTFYFLTATNTQKYRNLTQDAGAAIAIGFGPGYTCIQGEGLASLLQKDSEEERNAIAMVKDRMQKYEEHTTWPIFQLEDYEAEQIAAFKFVPQTLELLNLDKNQNLPITDQTLLTIL